MHRSELQALCRDRQLVTPELHPSNDFYGHAHLLKRYAGIPSASSLKAAVEHGVMIRDDFWEADLETELPVFLCARGLHAEDYQRRVGGRKRAFAVGPLLHYVTQSFAGPSDRCLLVFPAHSTHRVQARFDAQALAARIEVVGRDFNRIQICVYWKDLLEGLDRPFMERGFECVTAGHMYSPDFLPRLKALLCGSSAVLTNEVGTHVLYATLLRKPVWIDRQPVAYTAATEQILSTDAPEFLSHPNYVRLLELFSVLRGEVTAEQWSFVADLCGVASARSPAGLREILEQAEVDYRRGLTISRRAYHLLRRGRYYERLVRSTFHGGVLPARSSFPHG